MIIKFWKHFFMPIRLYGGGGSSGSDAQGAAEKQLSGISQEQWDWYKGNYLPSATQGVAESNAQAQQTVNYYNNNYLPQANADEAALTAQSKQSAANNNGIAATDMAQAQDQFNQANTLNAAENNYGIGTLAQMSAQANQTGGEADQEYQAMLARGDVDQQFQNSGMQLQAKEQQAGVGANSGQMLAVMNQNKVTQAGASAAAQTQARMAAKQLGWTYKQQVEQDAAGLGSQAAGSSAAGSTAASGANTAANSAVSNTAAPMSGLSTVAQGVQGAQTASGIPLSNQTILSAGLNGGATSASGAASSGGNIASQQAASQAQQSAQTSQAVGEGVGAAVAVGTTAAVII